MESYNNYQDIIDAIKAEYVIVRDLKRIANAKKRELNNAHSFVNRKGNEETTLETRVTNAKQEAFTRADNALDTIQSSIDSGYKSALSQSLAKLANIEAEITKLQTLQTNLPEKWESFTQNETNSINSLKGVLTSAINDTKFIYENDIMESNKFAILNDETKLSIDSDENDILTHYDTVVYRVKQLISSTNGEFQNYVLESLNLEEELKARKDTLISKTRDLVSLKSDLADLLDSNAPQTEIDAKEEAIDFQKSEILEWANNSKEKHYAVDVFYAQKHKRFSVYFEIIQSLYEEASEWINQPGINQLVRQSRGDYGREIQGSIRAFITPLLRSIQGKMDNVLYDEIRSTFDETSYAKFQGDRSLNNSYSKTQVLNDIDVFVYNNQEGKYELSKEVQQETWSDAFSYFKGLHQKASSYIYAKKQFDKDLYGYTNIWNSFYNEYDKGFNMYAPALAEAKRESNIQIGNEDSLANGIWSGTSEQESTYTDLLNLKRTRQYDLTIHSHRRSLLQTKSDLVRYFFPEFFSSYQPLFDAKVAAIATYDSLLPQLESLNAAISEAYNLLVTSSEPAEGYVYNEGMFIYVLDNADYATYLAADAALQSFKDNVNNPAYNAKELATVALSDFLNNYGQLDAFQWTFSYPEVISLTEEADGYALIITEIENHIQEINADIEAIRSEMTYVPATLDDKLKSKGNDSDMTFKSYKNYEYWSIFTTKHAQMLSDFSTRIMSLFDNLSSYQSTEVDALDQIKAFLDGNTAFSTYNAERNYSERTLDRMNIQGDFVKEIIRPLFNLTDNNYDQYFDWDSCQTQAFASDPTFLSESLRQNASNYRMHANPNFIEEIITFVNTGVSNF